MAEVLQKINWIDLIVVILLIRSSYVGFTKGLGWELFRFIGYLGAGLATIYHYENLSRLTADYFPVISSFSSLFSFTALYLAILFLFKSINLIIEKIIRIETFSLIERFGGLLLGLLRGALLISLLLISLVFTAIPYFEKSVKERSYTGYSLIKVAPFLYEKAALVFPDLKLGNRNAALSNIAGLRPRP